MRGMPCTLQGKGVLLEKWKKEGVVSFVSNEPTSVLDTRRSPSPPTSTSTLSSSFNGGGSGGSTDNTAGVAAVSGNTLQKWPTTSLPPETSSAAVTDGGGKDEWALELHPIPSGSEVITGGERCGFGLQDWESMLSEDQSLVRYISGDVVDDPSTFNLKQLLQGGTPLEFGGNAGLELDDHTSGFEPVGNNVMTSVNSNLGFPSSGVYLSNYNGKIGSVTPSSSGVLPNIGLNNNCTPQLSIFSSLANSTHFPSVSLPPGVLYQQQFETPDEKPQIFNSQVLMNQQQSESSTQNPNFFSPLLYAQQGQDLGQPQPKRHNTAGLDPGIHQIPKVPFVDPGHEFLLRKHQQQQVGGFLHNMQLLPNHMQQKPLMLNKQKEVGAGEETAHQQQQNQHQHNHHHHHHQQQQVLLDQLYKAAELVQTGNFSHAQGILARLNQQLSSVGKPLQRAAFYFKDALQLLLLMNNPVTSPPPRVPTPFDVIFKMGAYKVFSEVSPLIQFVNFTCNQALLEALDDADRIHIIDFDIGFGAHWASFMQELPVRSRGAPSLKITAFASLSTHHPLELVLMREHLTQFANEIGINLELEVVNFDTFDPASYSIPIFRSSETEAIAVNFPIWSSSTHPSALPSILRFIKQLSPRIMVSLDRGCDRTDLPFSQHFLHALQSYTVLLESLDAVNVTPDAVSKIERFLLQPRIESSVLGRLRAPDTMPLWKTLFASAGFSPLTFSNFTETQAECVVKRTQVRGFHVEKRQASLVLCWQRRELISASAWRC